jgi:3-oxoacyl-[acyl-carrier-protein] synthase-1
MDGFIPSEGAAFVVLSTAHGPGDVRMAPVVTAVAGASDPGHLYGSAPARGEGLARALDGLRAQLPAGTPAVACTWAGLNGENFGAKEWGVAQLRHRDLFCASMQIEHPADCYGDLGAATGAMLLALADRTMRSGTRPGPALVWAASDREPVGCAYLSPPLF